MAQGLHLLLQSVGVGPKVALVLPDGMGHAGIPQLHIGDVVLAVQIQHTGVVQLHPVLLSLKVPAGDQSGIGLHHHGISCNADLVGKAADAPGAVAAHFAPGAVGIVKMESEIRPVGIIHRHKPIRTGDGAELFCQGRIVGGQSSAVHDHEVIPGAVHIVNLHVSASRNKKCSYQLAAARRLIVI